MPRQSIDSPHYHVPIPGFSQIVAAPTHGRLLFVSGLTARTADGTIVGVDDLPTQMRQVFENMRMLLDDAKAGLEDVVQIRTFLRDMGQWSTIEPIWREYWGDHWPASTLVEVARLFDERQLVEMEAVAVVNSD